MIQNDKDKIVQKLLDQIELKDKRIHELEEQLKANGIFVMSADQKLSADEKIMVFMDYFRCRTDIYAERFYSKKKQSWGWAPACNNNFSNVCAKRSGKFNCFQCEYRAFSKLTPQVLKNHFRGNHPGIGLYPMFDDNTCSFLAIDFDDERWIDEMRSVYDEALKHRLYPVMERSQSGSGGHLWFFFAVPVKALTARKLGEYLLREAMKANRNIRFSSFDRMFPNQDYIPDNGKGNLIAAPLRFDAFMKGNSAFINTSQQVIDNQIEYLASRKKISQEEIDSILSVNWNDDYFFDGNQLSMAMVTDVKYVHDLYGTVSTCIRLNKENINSVTRDILCRCASMYNPKYFELQRLHKPIYINGEFTRILSYYEEDDRYIYLPRGILPTIQKVMPETVFHLEDHTSSGSSIDVSFAKELRDNQKEAAETLLKNTMGILQAAPGFGKTVIGLYLISQLKVSTLILVDSKEIQEQWAERIEQFLDYPHAAKKKDRFVCKYGGSSKKLNGNIDIAMVRSLKNRDDLSSLLNGYGLTIIDECHHVVCESFLHVMRHVSSKYIYGLSATPKRDDGLFKVITMYCGPIRKQITRESIRSGYSFKQYLIPRYSNHRILKKDYSYTDMCTELMKDSVRNFMIMKDVINEYRSQSNIIILTERIEHLNILFNMLEKACDDVYMLSGSVSKKERKTTLEEVRNNNKQYILLATSKLLGEGFDLPSLNCLFLVLPISAETRITQYTGRIHRNYEGKDTVKVYDYVDAQISMAQSMYLRRLKQYQKEGYFIFNEKNKEETVDHILYDKESYESTLLRDISNASKEIVIFSVSLVSSRLSKYHDILHEAIKRGVSVHIILSSAKNYDNEGIKRLIGIGADITYTHHSKHFIIIDRQIVWNCSFDLFGNVPAEAFATRDENRTASEEVISSVQKLSDQNSNDGFLI